MSEPAKSRAAGRQHRESVREMMTVPNGLSLVRLAGCPVLIALALYDRPAVFICVYVFLILTDWFDGKLALVLHQRTEIGARLDSLADVLLYATLLFGVAWLKWTFVFEHALWILALAASYTLTATTGLVRFGHIPTYHTYGAKASSHLMNLAVVLIFVGWGEWLFYVGCCAVILTNLEATAISLLLDERRVDVPSFLHARKLQDQITRVRSSCRNERSAQESNGRPSGTAQVEERQR